MVRTDFVKLGSDTICLLFNIIALELEMPTLAEAGAILGVSPATLRRQVHNGKLRATLVGKTYTVTTREIERYRAESLGRIGRPVGAKDGSPRKRDHRSSSA